MITCPNCAHANPDTAVECEACYTPLPAMISCPNCNATAPAEAHFCGQCGYDLQHNQAAVQPMPPSPAPSSQPLAPTVIGNTRAEASMPQQPATPDGVDLPPMSGEASIPDGTQSPPSPAGAGETQGASTRLQQTAACLFHVQSNSVIELPLHLNVIHIGKPNGQIPPDIDLSGVADSDIVSRIHADIRVEGDTFYLEDLGSSNGTYVNNLPLHMGNRHRLCPGDRIAFGKGDKVSFLFQLA